jgi:hypothetical protein
VMGSCNATASPSGLVRAIVRMVGRGMQPSV